MRRLALLLIALLALTPLACGGGGAGEEKSPAEAVAAAGKKTAAAESSKFGFNAKIKPPAAVSAETFEFSGSGEMDYRRRLGRLSYDLSGLLEAAGQEAPDAQAEVVFDDYVLYMRFPLLSQTLPGGKPWVKIDLEELNKQRGVDLGQLSQLSWSDPSQTLALLKATSGEIEEVGQEDVRGVETTRYRLTVDLAKVADAAPAASRDQVRASMRRLIEQTRTRTIPVQVWIDDDGLLRRQRMSMKYAVPSGASGQPQQAEMTMTTELFDFGTKVDAQVPPAAQVADLADLIGKQGS